ncbi:hypothetical protein BofuT4_uP029130.1 [Botrytis cinerea T4]|uniref:Uncharacterized protein n=1 Tax=Botryotinia fuckeliana (strain T4) TaxID=999810 RepID=G2Y8W1_BOTF4|nr:hypothetical protein BofuT4_uP029130.1 [Botrytis cinerea T4]
MFYTVPVDLGFSITLPIRELKKVRKNSSNSQRPARSPRRLSFHFKHLIPPTFTISDEQDVKDASSNPSEIKS